MALTQVWQRRRSGKLTGMTALDDPTTNEALPRWSFADVYDSLDGRAFVGDFEGLEADITRTIALFDELGIKAIEPRDVTAADVAAIERALPEMNRTNETLLRLFTCVETTVAANSYDDAAQALSSRLYALDASLAPLETRLANWVSALGVEGLAAGSPQADDHRGPLTRLAARAAHQMSEPEEALYSELSTTGRSSWVSLHSDITSQLTATVTFPDGTSDTMPMAAVRGLANHSDPDIRQAAYRAEMATWPTVALPCSAAMNAIKGDAVIVNRRRHWDHHLSASLYANSITRETFEAMQSAVVDSLPDFRRWMRVKSAAHGHAGALPWWDLVAPLPIEQGTLDFNTGVDIVTDAFNSFSPRLGTLPRRALHERWIDAGPRDGKVGGAFCAPFVDDRSLVLLNWRNSMDSVQTLAHELGHAYHNTQLAERTVLQKQLPMALAETASIFCETLVVEAGLQRVSGAERLALLDVDLIGTNQIVVDIHSRFLFESAVYEQRAKSKIGVDEFSAMMGEAQLTAYGDGLDQTTAHPYMWAVKPHYYGSSFYNWPYTFGALFGLGLFQQFGTDPDKFRLGYDDLLSRCGMATAEELGGQFGIDVTDVAFWTASLDVVRQRIADYVRLCAELGLTE